MKLRAAHGPRGPAPLLLLSMLTKQHACSQFLQQLCSSLCTANKTA